jgi:ubiquinone/menaquinone biosynthesis C-methylase UbiE
MDHTDHVNLLRPANLPLGGHWADLGAGGGAFTLALRELIGEEDAIIYAVDKDRSALNQLERAYRARFGLNSNLTLLPNDFSRPLNLFQLDGIVMANSLHFFKDRVKILEHVRSFLKPTGQLLIVEYNTESGNHWVPYPFTFETFVKLTSQAGFDKPKLLTTHASSFLHGFYSAICTPLG